MIIIDNQFFTIYGGDASCAVDLNKIKNENDFSKINHLADRVQLSRVAFLQQTHGTQGLYIGPDDHLDYHYALQGDYIITQQKSYGLAVLTADCLPIAVYDETTKTVAMIHAGWKGLLAGIFQQTMYDMGAKVATNPQDCQIYLGPSAAVCCYEVQQDFIDAFSVYQNITSCFVEKNGKIFFNSRLFIIIIATSLGIKPEKIYTTYNVCTICDLSFCSYRRDKYTALRQISMIFLK
jgi:YfiH family protein